MKASGSGRGKKNRRLEDQPWYHGLLPREQIETLLEDEGDFLVRATQQQEHLQIVISTMHAGKLAHFILQREEDGWKLEARPYSSVFELVRDYYKTGRPLTKNSGAVLKQAVQKQHWMIGHNDFRETEKLGSGAFGEVWKGKYKTPDGAWRTVAIKKCNKAVMTDEQRKAFVKEARLQSNYKHPNVVRLIGVAADRPPIRLILEFCPGGSLETFLKMRKPPMSMKVRFCAEAARGMEYLSSKGCVHRDLAARNCLIGRDAALKISDFGMSREGVYQTVTKKGAKLPVRWCALEALNKGAWTSASDVYSFGVLLWEIMTDATKPWPEFETNKQVYQAVSEGKQLMPPRETPEDIKNVMRRCWGLNPDGRPSFLVIRQELDKMPAAQPSAESLDD